MANDKKVRVVRSSGNVFEDLGFGREEAEHLKIRRTLMAAIRRARKSQDYLVHAKEVSSLPLKLD
jgi:predicted XRE-type DNA-binding protein